MNKKIIMLVVLSLLIMILSGCSNKEYTTGASTNNKEYTAEDLQRLSRLEVYAADKALINTIENKETLFQFNKLCIDPMEYTDQQEEIQEKLKEYEPQYIITSYKTPAARYNNGSLEKLFDITVYKDTHMIMMQVSPDTVKNFPVPSEYLTYYYEVSDDVMDFLISLAVE